MVASIDEMFQVIQSNPFIDGIGYFVEITTQKEVPQAGLETLTEKMQQNFCDHSQATLEGENVLGLDFHEHILTQGEDADYFMQALEGMLREVEMLYGIEHLCMEFQFDFSRAKAARVQIDELLQP